MRSHFLRCGISTLLLLTVSASYGAQQPDDVVAPFVAPDMLVVVRGEVDRIGENALADLLIQTVKEPELDTPQRDMLRRWWKTWSNIGDGPISDFRDLGVKRVYWVIALQDFVDPYKPTGTWVFPIEGKADAQKVIEVARRHKLDAQQIGDVVAASLPGRPINIGTGRDLPAAWSRALAAEKDAAIRIAIVPSEILRRSFEENLPGIPTLTGSIPITTLTHGIEWIGISVMFAPNPQISMVAQTPNASAAQAITDVLDRTLLSDLRRAPNWRIPPFYLAPADLAELLKPTITADQLQWEPGFQKVLAPTIARGVREGIRFHSEANMRQILQGVLMYANNHTGQTAPDLNALIKDQDMSPQVLIDPLDAGEKVGFIYVRPMGNWQEHSQDWAVLYETSPRGFNVGFADGHVEWFPTRKQVEEQVRVAEERNQRAEEKK